MSAAPATHLPEDAPEILRTAERTLRTAALQLVQMAEHIALWKALGTDTELHERLYRSYVGSVTYNLYVTLQNSIVLGLARLFDDEARALDVAVPMNAIAEPANAAWLLERQRAHFFGMHVHDAGGHSMDEQARADMMRMIQEWSAGEAGAEFEQRMAAFVKAKRDFRRGEVGEALKRLKEMRRKEVAHTDLQPVWRTARPKVNDLSLVFDAVRQLVWSANRLCTGIDHNDLRDLTRAEAMARCFAAVLRRETLEEHRTADEAAQADASKDQDEYVWARRATAFTGDDGRP